MARETALHNLRNRRNPEGRILKEAFTHAREDDATKYLLGAMQAVDDLYTKTTYEQGDRVKNQVSKGLEDNSLVADYEYQGSATKNTHIKAYSDIDLLVIDLRSVTVDDLAGTVLYGGNATSDLLQVRSIVTDKLSRAFWEATIDQSGAKSVKISGASLRRIVDVVMAKWYNSRRYLSTLEKRDRGVDILDAHVPTRIGDHPFIHNHLIDVRDGNTWGNFRKLVRLLKSLKYDSEGRVTMSSFDIESLVYRMPDERFWKFDGQEIQLAFNCYNWLGRIEEDTNEREKLEVPDGVRRIFAQGKATLVQLSALRRELGTLLYDIEQGLARSFRKLGEARIQW